MALLLLSHAVLAPLTMGLYLDIHKTSAVNMQRALDSLPRDIAISSQTLVVVNPPDYTYCVGTISPFLVAAGDSAPPRVRALSAGSGDVEVTRVDARTLEVRLPQGLFPSSFSRYYRSAEVGFSLGDRHTLSDMTSEVRELNADGDPALIRYRFTVPLEHDSLRWLRWRDGVYEPWSPPSIGEREVLPPSRSIFGV